MKRRDFIVGMGLTSVLIQRNALSQDSILNFLAPTRVFPKERFEQREYDLTVPEIVVWRTETKTPGYPGDVTSRTVGFVEAASDQNKLLYLAGFLLRQEMRPEFAKGFFLYFGATLSYLSLPRRLTGRESKLQDRYAFDETLSALSTEGIKAGLVGIDYRQMKLIENDKVYVPDSFVNSLALTGALPKKSLYLEAITGLASYPKKDLMGSYFEINQVLHFDIDHLPLNFKIELPPLLINGAKIQLPICYFAPYDM